jgi:CRS1 / YhbY (CRM) domain
MTGTYNCFSEGRNKHHQGLAQAILKLWEKSLVVKIVVKRGVQNTNNKLMAEELKVFIQLLLILLCLVSYCHLFYFYSIKK